MGVKFKYQPLVQRGLSAWNRPCPPDSPEIHYFYSFKATMGYHRLPLNPFSISHGPLHQGGIVGALVRHQKSGYENNSFWDWPVDFGSLQSKKK